MECVTKDKIKNTVDEVRKTSFEEKLNSQLNNTNTVSLGQYYINSKCKGKF